MKVRVYLTIAIMVLACGCESDSSGTYETGGSGSGSSSGGPTYTQSGSTEIDTTLHIDSPPVTINVQPTSVQSNP